MKLLIRNVPGRLVALLKRRARRNQRSLQAELRTIIERAAVSDIIDSAELAAHIRRKLSGRKHSDSAVLIAEDRRR